MLSIGKLGAGQENYYLDAVADGAEDYYVHAGEAPGQWLGGGAAALGLGGVVGAAEFRSMLQGRRPGTDEALGRMTKVPGFDLTFSAPKSASLLFALGEPALADAVRQAHDAAVRDALGYLEQVAAHGRRGHGGLVRIGTRGFVAAAFRHRTSRAGDPHLHTHVVVANRVHGEDGAWTALDARSLYVQAKTAGTLYSASLRHQLQDLGLTWTVAANGLAELDGIPREVLRAFSTRRKQIEAALGERGLSSARAAQAATLHTRAGKETGVDQDTLQGRWRAQAAELGFDAAALGTLLAFGRDRLAETAPATKDLPDVAALTECRSTFGEREVLRAVAGSLAAGGSVADVVSLTRRVLESPGVVPLDDRERVLRGEPVLRRRTRRGLVPLGASEQRWSTEDLLLLEQRVVHFALSGRGTALAGDPQAVADALVDHRQLNGEQRELVRRLVLEPDLVQVVSAAAGSGKTTALGAAAQAWRASGTPVVGVTLAAKAALVLHEETGVPAYTLARALLDLRDNRGTPLQAGTVVLVDEAGQVGTRALAELLGHVQHAGGKLVLVGDPHQLPEIDAGGAYRGLINRLPGLSLEANHRQRDPGEQARLLELRKGDVVTALRSYDACGRIVRAADGAEVKARLVDDWATAALPSWGERKGQVVMIGLTNRDVDDLNELARARLQRAGLVAAESLTVGQRAFAVGDEVVTRQNDRLIGVLNGERWAVTSIVDGALALEQGERRVVLPKHYVDVQHAYALTTAISQGSTVDRAFVLGSDTTYREAGYTAASRARQSTTFYVVAGDHEEHGCDERHGAQADSLDPVEQFAVALGRSAAEDMAMDSDPGTSPQYVGAAARRYLLDEQDRLREQLADAPADLTHRLRRTRRELAAAEQAVSASAAPIGVNRATPWARRAAELAAEVAELERHQDLRAAWAATNAALLERERHVTEQLRAFDPRADRDREVAEVAFG